MPQHTYTHRCAAALPLFRLALAMLRLGLTGVSVRELSAQAALTVTGHFRPRPDPSIERALRAAFADLDKELAGILGDHTPRGNHD